VFPGISAVRDLVACLLLLAAPFAAVRPLAAQASGATASGIRDPNGHPFRTPAGSPLEPVHRLALLSATRDSLRDGIALAEIGERLGFLSGSPTLGISAHTGRGVNRILENLGGTVEQYRRRIPTRAVNRAIRDAQAAHAAPGGARVLYATQGATDPPTFTLFVNRRLPPTYLRYLQRRFAETFDLGSVPVKFHVRFR